MEMTQSSGRILVIDDSAAWREIICGHLREADYDVQSAKDPAEAKDFLNKKPYHVAVIDLRLDEQDEKNTDGLTLAEEIKVKFPELIILLLIDEENPIDKENPNRSAAIHALQLQDRGFRTAFDFLVKQHEINELPQRVKKAFATAVNINLRLDIIINPSLDWSKLQREYEDLQREFNDLQQLSSDTANDLLQRIFHQAQRIEVKEENIGRRRMILVTEITGLEMTKNIYVRFSHREHVERELRNFRDCVENYVGGATRAQRLIIRTLGSLGGIAYSFYGTDATYMQRFGDVYTSKDSTSIKYILDHLFKDTCYKWYFTRLQKKDQISLSIRYRDRLRLETSKLEKNFVEIVRHLNTGELSFIGSDSRHEADILLNESIRLTNPLRLIDVPMTYGGPLCYNHGKLHENNILVDSHNKTWLIDFSQTEAGHPVRDFAMLESSIKFYLQRSKCSSVMLHEWEQRLLNVETLNDNLRLDPHLQQESELIKATELIVHIRSLLSQVLPDMTLRDYRISLYFHALKGMTLTEKFTERQRLHALISASLLADLLRQPQTVPEPILEEQPREDQVEPLLERRKEVQESLARLHKQALDDIMKYIVDKLRWTATEQIHRQEHIESMKQYVEAKVIAFSNKIETATSKADLDEIQKQFSDEGKQWANDALEQILR